MEYLKKMNLKCACVTLACPDGLEAIVLFIFEKQQHKDVQLRIIGLGK